VLLHGDDHGAHQGADGGRLVNLSFYDGVQPSRMPMRIPGCFVLFDSLEDKDTIRVLASAKKPVLEALELLNPYGIHSVRDFYDLPGACPYSQSSAVSTAGSCPRA
jgi:hypothetical protein